MKLEKTALLILCVLAVIVLPASAEVLHPEMVDFNKTIAYSDLGLTGQQDIQVWVGNILVMTGNTSAGYLPQPVGDYHVIVKPSLINRWMNNPPLFLKDAMDYLLAFALPIFIILGLGAILIGLAHAGRKH